MDVQNKAVSFLKRAGVRKVASAIPILGVFVSIFFIAKKIREKGLARGSADAALTATPVVGRAKALYELFGDDVIPPKPA